MNDNNCEKWIETTLGKAATFQRGFDLPTRERKNGEYPLIASNGQDGTHNEFKVKAPGVVTGRSGTLGNIFYVSESFWPLNTTLWVKDFHKNNEKFIYYFLKTIPLDKFNTGSGVPTLNRNHIHPLPIKIPPLQQQTKIAKTLSVLDDKITLLYQQNETLEGLAQLLFKRWFLEFQFPDNEGKPYESSGGKMMESELGEIPKGWEVSSLGENVETLGGGTPSTTEETYWTNGEILWYSPTDLSAANAMFSNDSAKKITELGLQKSSAKLFPPYSLLMSSRATVGLMTINTIEASTNQGFIITVPNDKVSIYFLYGWLKTKLKEVHNLASGSTFPEISKTDFRGLDLIIPSGNVKEGFDRLSQPIFKNIENNLKEIQTLMKLRDTLLPKLMSGELRVKN